MQRQELHHYNYNINDSIKLYQHFHETMDHYDHLNEAISCMYIVVIVTCILLLLVIVVVVIHVYCYYIPDNT